MELLVIRHGIAEPRDPNKNDFDRPLTERGIARAQHAAEGLARIEPTPQLILTSPKLRARQTAAILGEVFDRQPEIRDELVSESPEKILAMLHRLKTPRIMIVGHEPTLSELIEMICTKGTAHGFIDLKKAGGVLLDAPIEQSARPGYGKLIWAMSPRVLRALSNH